MGNIFISHITQEAESAISLQEHLVENFGEQIRVFVASHERSIAPGDDWFKKITENLKTADVMLVLCSPESVGRPWIQFESGAAWFNDSTTVVFVCYNGMSPNSLPQPMNRLQAIKAIGEEERELDLEKVVEFVEKRFGLTRTGISQPALLKAASEEQETVKSTVHRWLMRPGAYVSERLSGGFRVGTLQAADPAKALAAQLDPDDTLFCRLYISPDEQTFINCMADGNIADFLEDHDLGGRLVTAEVEFVSLHHNPGERSSPLLVIRSIDHAPPG